MAQHWDSGPAVRAGGRRLTTTRLASLSNLARESRTSSAKEVWGWEVALPFCRLVTCAPLPTHPLALVRLRRECHGRLRLAEAAHLTHEDAVQAVRDDTALAHLADAVQVGKPRVNEDEAPVPGAGARPALGRVTGLLLGVA
jgi:hypothetical protein